MRNSFKEQITVAESSARTASADFTFSTGSLGGIFVIRCTASAATPSVVFTIKGNAPGSGSSWDILASSAVTGSGTTVLKVHPSLTASANAVAQDVLPAGVTVSATHADADSITYSIEFIGVN